MPHDREAGAIDNVRPAAPEVSHGVPVLQIDGATVRKGEGRGRVILDDIRLEIRPGEHTAILGANGSGKSSLIKLITQEYRPLARETEEPIVRIFGRERWDVVALRSHLGIVSAELQRDFVEAAESASLRGIEVALSGFFASHGVWPHQVVTEEMRRRAREALELMGAEYLENKLLREMTPGEARRVLIARALAPDPAALLLDEPTSGLDVVARHHFLEAVRGLAHRGKTMILVTHRLEEIIPEVERMILIRDGRIIRDGPSSQLMTSQVLSELFDAALEVSRGSNGYYRISMDAAY